MFRRSLANTISMMMGIVLVAIFALASSASGALVLPVGFSDELLANVPSPTGIAFTPDGRLLITSQRGKVYVFQNENLVSTPALDLSSKVCYKLDTGMLSVAVDPLFTTNRFVYLFYTFKNGGICSNDSGSPPVQRVSRFTLGDNNVISAVSETVLIDNVPSPYPNHAGADLEFGKDGYLYISLGDGGCNYKDPTQCQANNNAARDENILLGKVLRITRDGGIPPTNPFLGSDSARCARTGRTEPGKRCQETFAWGLRNPFRLAFDPNAATTRFFINDVGYHAWEEINEGQRGADYGWSVREGNCPKNVSTNCSPNPSGMTAPVYDYSHKTKCTSVTGGAFVPNRAWPESYNNSYLFADFVCGTIFKLTPSNNGYVTSQFMTGLGVNSVVDMIFGPYGTAQALYYTTYGGAYSGTTGELHRITYTGSANRTPTASMSATPRSGTTPLTVTFDASASSDPDDGNTLTYLWNFGDNTAPIETNNPTVTHTYTTNGQRTATLRVRDNLGAVSAPVTVRIDVGNNAPTPTILAPAADLRFKVGQTITLQGRAADAEDGPLPESAMTWRVILRHNEHTHQLLSATPGNNLTFKTPPPEELPGTTTSYLEIELTATDSQGTATTIRQALRPRLVEITFESQPSSMMLTVNDEPLSTPQTITSWEGYDLEISALPQSHANSCGQALRFASWSDGGAAKHIVATPATPATYKATYSASGTCKTWIPMITK